MKIVLASQNKKKIVELRTLLGEMIPDIEILSLADVGITEDIVEDGDSFEANALIKARAAAASGYIGVGDDSGLCVEALDGAPGIYSARYAGEHGDDEANLDLVLKNMEGKTDRRAAFVCCIACAFPDGSEPIVCHGRVDGELLCARDGEGGFGYDPIFYYPPFGKSFGVSSAEEKNKVSHRARALNAFAKALAARLMEQQ
ncbi:MAG: RdgB/HAM1 family non-canonical purine NTP pyrophosphatase [Clostridia bacterium]|nr:RdgB/HAM1 family non-canonical purine NTP pyrophosphatase [Clostridia bacterium]